MNKKKAKIYKILFVLFFIIFVILAIVVIVNAPIICWDGFDKVKNQMIGGCYREYSISIMLLVIPFILWLIVEIVLLILYSRNRKQPVII